MEGDAMRTLLRRTLPALVCTLALLALLPQGRAQNIGDDTNAAAIPKGDGTTWAQSMHQVMGGTSNTLPGVGTVRGPAGVYAVVRLTDRINDALRTTGVGTLAPCEPVVSQAVDDALTAYFNYLLEPSLLFNPNSGLVILAQWDDLSTCDPGTNLESPNPGSFRFNYLDDAFSAIEAWNADNPSLPPKTLQLVVTPGFNSPAWLTGELNTCDGLFVSYFPAPARDCDYTSIFYRVENAPQVQWPLPLPWSQGYKDRWKFFLTALNNHIGSRQEFVSIAVAGPTASSAEIILPNDNSSTNKTKPNLNAGAHALQLPGMSKGISVYTAWNCLLGNNYGETGNCLSEHRGYGAMSSYVNSNRAFIEEWASAIDMYGQIFSGVTLVVTTGKGLPEFPNPNPFFQTPPPAFEADCSKSSTATMDCAAETAILAYFAAPSVGGPNAKATEEDGLVAGGGKVLSAAGVKWLAGQTSTGFSVLPKSPALVSRMLGGLQFGQPFSVNPMGEGSASTPEQALLNVLKNFFKGTAVASTFDMGTETNNGEPVVNAPVNYLQVWEEDFLYAYGWQNCTPKQLMTKPANKGGPPPGCNVVKMKNMPTVPFMHSPATAADLLRAANDAILLFTAETAALPPTCGCSGVFVPRGAFLGDPVCVTQAEQNQVQADNTAAMSGSTYSPGFNYTVDPDVPYGVCKQFHSSVPHVDLRPLVYRQAYMGDYVCVTFDQASRVATDNASYPKHVKACAPPPRGGPLP
jgi:hypothetical protein